MPRRAAPAADVEVPKAWHLLVAICFGMPVAAAFSFAGVRGAGVRAYALVIPLSAMIGVACAWLLEIARIRLHAHVVRPRESVPGWYAQAL